MYFKHSFASELMESFTDWEAFPKQTFIHLQNLNDIIRTRMMLETKSICCPFKKQYYNKVTVVVFPGD